MDKSPAPGKLPGPPLQGAGTTASSSSTTSAGGTTSPPSLLDPPSAPRLGPQPSPTSRVMRHGSRLLWLPTGPVTLPGLRRVRVDIAGLAHPEPVDAKGGPGQSPRPLQARGVSRGHAPAVHATKHLPVGLSPRSPSGTCAEVVRQALAGRLAPSELEVAGAKLAERIGYWQLPAAHRRDVHLAMVLPSLDDDGDLPPSCAAPLGAFLRGLCTAPSTPAEHLVDAGAAFVTDLVDAQAPLACAERFDREEIGFAELYMAALPIAAFAAADSPLLAARLVRLALVRPPGVSAEDWSELPAETWTQAVHVLMQPAGERTLRRAAVAQALVEIAASGRAARDACGFGMAGLGPLDLATARAILGRCLRADLDPLELGLLAWGLQISPLRTDGEHPPADSRRDIEGLHNTHILCASWDDQNFRVAAALEALMQAAATAQDRVELLRGVLAARAYSARALQAFADKQRTALSLRHGREPDWVFDAGMTLQAQFDTALPVAIARLVPHCTTARLMELVHRLAMGEARPMPRWRTQAVCSTIAHAAADDTVDVIETKGDAAGKASVPAAKPLEDIVRTGLALVPNDAATVSALPGMDTAQKLDLLEAGGRWTDVSPERMARMLGDLEAGRHAKVAPALRAAILYRIVQRNLAAVTPQLLTRARECFLADHADSEAARAQFGRLALAWQRARGPAAVPVVEPTETTASSSTTTTMTSATSTSTTSAASWSSSG